MSQENEVSKTQRKREMHALQSLGEELVRLAPERLARMELPESLHAAILEAQRITQRGALRRQLQYVGRLMRDVDASPIRQQLALLQTGQAQDAAFSRRAQRWRERLLSDDSALAEFVSAFPGTDVQQLRTSLRNARLEREAARPPRFYRGLLRNISEAMSNVPDAARQDE